MKIPPLTLKNVLIPVIAVLPFLISCKDQQTTGEATPAKAPELTLEQKKQVLQNAAPASNATTSGDLAINPAHGQPGHRCDIPVGAPLNGTSGNTGGTPAQTINMNQEKTVPAATSGNVTINPPHGQPGHRCDVKVGDPL